MYPSEIKGVVQSVVDPRISRDEKDFTEYYWHGVKPSSDNELKFLILKFRVNECYRLAYERMMLGLEE